LRHERPVILDESKTWNADLIVLGSHGRHGIERVLNGSVAEYVAKYAACSSRSCPMTMV
jgi:nucleotide-binding universal stress UspA family protein